MAPAGCGSGNNFLWQDTGSLSPSCSNWLRKAPIYRQVERLGEADLLALHIYTRCTLNPGGSLDSLAGGAEKALETSSAGAIWFTRCRLS